MVTGSRTGSSAGAPDGSRSVRSSHVLNEGKDHVRPARAINRDVSGGFSGLVAAGLFVLSSVLTQIGSPGPGYDSGGAYLRSVVLVLAFLAAVGAILGVHAAQRTHPKYGPVGVTGAWLAGPGYAVVALHTVFGMIAGSGQTALTVRLVAAGAVMLGCAALGIATLRTRILPWWCGVLLIVAFPLGDVADAVVPGAEGILLALLWGSVGIALLRIRPAVGGAAGLRAGSSP